MLIWRIIGGLSISACVVGLCFLDVFLEKRTGIPAIALFPLLILIVTLLCREMLNIARKNHVFPVQYVTYLGCFLVAVSGWGALLIQGDTHLAAEPESVQITAPAEVPTSPDTLTPKHTLIHKLGHLNPGNWVLSAFSFALILVFAQEVYSFVRPGAINIRIAYTVLTITYVGMLMAFLTLIRLMFGMSALIAFIAIIKMGDVGAYTVGRLLGRNKMAPDLSPGKTIEGAFGAVLFACLTATLFWYIVEPWITGEPRSMLMLPWAMLYGAALGLVGVFGDLAESLLKRDAEVKDAGTLVPGFGGVMDVMDSLLLAAPVAYALLTLL